MNKRHDKKYNKFVLDDFNKLVGTSEYLGIALEFKKRPFTRFLGPRSRIRQLFKVVIF